MAAESITLTAVEQRLVEHVTQGRMLDLAGDATVDEAAMRSWGDHRTIRAVVIRDILLGRLAPDPDPRGVWLRGARIQGRVDLTLVTSRVALKLYNCFLGSGVNVHDADLRALSLAGCLLEHPSMPPLDARSLIVGTLDLDGAIISGDCKTGALRLLDARIGNQLSCKGAKLINKSGVGLDGDEMQVGQSAFLDNGFTAEGAGDYGTVRLPDAQVRGTLSCKGAKLTNESGPALSAHRAKVDQDVFLNAGFTAEGAGDPATVGLRNTRVGGVIVLDASRLKNTHNSQARLQLDGLVYSGLPSTPGGNWLDLLRNATPNYAAQPYQQLATAHRAAGHDIDTRRVLMAQRRDQIRRAMTGRAERTWARFTGLTLGYGYQPWRALVGLLAVVLTAVILSITIGDSGALARVDTDDSVAEHCSTIEKVGIGLDVGLPLINTGTRDHCDTTDTTAGERLTVAGWVLQVLAWGFATLFVAGFTRAVRKT